MLKYVKLWSLYIRGSSAPKVVNKTALPTFIHIIFSLCACPHSLSWTHFCKWEMVAPLASTATPKSGKGYKIWHMDCYFKSSTSASNQQERMLHSNLPHEPPSCTWLASASVPYRAKKQMTSIGHQICSPSQKPFSLLSTQPSGITKSASPPLILKSFLLH